MKKTFKLYSSSPYLKHAFSNEPILVQFKDKNKNWYDNSEGLINEHQQSIKTKYNQQETKEKINYYWSFVGIFKWIIYFRI